MLSSTAKQRTGRRRGATGTREGILRAARGLFARRGYDGASIRAVASRAAVDPALVLHFFGSKADLFAASLQLPFELSELEQVLSGNRGAWGRRIATFYLKRVFHERAETVQSLLRSSVTNPEAAAILRRMIESTALVVFERRFDGPQAKLRGELVASHMMGLFLARHILALEPVASASDAQLVDLVAPALQQYLAPRRRGRT